MSGRTWFDNDVTEKWIPWVMLVALAVIGPGVIDTAFDERTAWKTLIAIVWAMLVLLQVYTLVRRSRRGRAVGADAVDPASIPAHDVASVIASTTSRVSAVKLLRERHPGLGLKQAVDLVDAATPAP